MRSTLQITAFALLIASICALGLVWYAGSYISGLALDQANSAATASQESDRIAYAARVKAISADTAQERASLDALMHEDVVGIANTLEATAAGVGVSAKVSDAVAQGAPASISTGTTLQALSFVVEASGSFADLARVASAYEALPLPSTVDEIEISRPVVADSTGAAPWHLTIRVRVLTTSSVSL